MKKIYLIITLHGGRQLKKEIPRDINLPIGFNAHHQSLQQIAFAVANHGCIDSENSTENNLIYIAPSAIRTSEIILE
jgi:hypothetical protein